MNTATGCRTLDTMGELGVDIETESLREGQLLETDKRMGEGIVLCGGACVCTGVCVCVCVCVCVLCLWWAQIECEWAECVCPCVPLLYYTMVVYLSGHNCVVDSETETCQGDMQTEQEDM